MKQIREYVELIYILGKSNESTAHPCKKQFYMEASEDNLIAKSEKCFSLGFSEHSNTDRGSK